MRVEFGSFTVCTSTATRSQILRHWKCPGGRRAVAMAEARLFTTGKIKPSYRKLGPESSSRTVKTSGL